MPYEHQTIPLGNEAKRYILDEFKWFPDVGQLLHAIDFSDAVFHPEGDRAYVGHVQLNVGLGRAALIGDVYMDEELTEEVLNICRVEQAQQVDDLPELIAHSNMYIRKFAREKLERLLREAI